eukprot:PhM_4_TR5059/c0_g1_i1/m.44323
MQVYSDLEGHSVATCQTTVWVYGGKLRATQRYMDTMLRITQEDGEWTVADMHVPGTPFARWFHGACLVDTAWYVHGGLGPEGFDPNNVIHRCDLSPSTVLWSNARTSGTVPSIRCNHTLTSVRSTELMLFGGFPLVADASNNCTVEPADRGRAYVLNINTLMWTDVDVTSMPSTWGHAHCAPFPGSPMVLLFGGVHVDSDETLGLWSVDISKRQCIMFEADETSEPNPDGRILATVVHAGQGFLLLFGGMVNQEAKGDLWAVDTSDGTWIRLVSAPCCSKGHAAVWMGSAMVVVGGNDNSLVQVYDAVTGAWDHSLTLTRALTRTFDCQALRSKTLKATGQSHDSPTVPPRVPVLLPTPVTTGYVPPKPATVNRNLALLLSVISIRLQHEAQQAAAEQWNQAPVTARTPLFPPPHSSTPEGPPRQCLLPGVADPADYQSHVKTPTTPDSSRLSPPPPVPGRHSPQTPAAPSPKTTNIIRTPTRAELDKIERTLRAGVLKTPHVPTDIPTVNTLGSNAAAAPSNAPAAMSHHFHRAFRSL